MPAECVFCQIVAGDAPSYKVAEDDLTVAFLDRGQATDGHTLIVPRTHASDIWEISERDATAAMNMARRVAHLLDERLTPDGLNLIQANRPAVWQTVFHIHLVPRWSGDGLTPPLTASDASADRLATTLARLSIAAETVPDRCS